MDNLGGADTPLLFPTDFLSSGEEALAEGTEAEGAGAGGVAASVVFAGGAAAEGAGGDNAAFAASFSSAKSES